MRCRNPAGRAFWTIHCRTRAAIRRFTGLAVFFSPDQKKSAEPPVTLPEKYRDPETSGLKYNITSQTKELHIEIE